MIPCRAQISAEYVILTSFILIAIILPSGMFLYSSTSRTARETLSQQLSIELGNGLLKDAQQIYFLGLYTRKNAVYDVPENLEKMFIVELIDDDDNHHYYLGMKFNEGNKHQSYMFQSDVPLTSDYTNPFVDPSGGISEVKECDTYTCTFYSFIGNTIHSGRKVFRLETIMDGTVTKVSITPETE